MDTQKNSKVLKKDESEDTIKKINTHESTENHPITNEFIELETGRQTRNEAFLDDQKNSQDDHSAEHLRSLSSNQRNEKNTPKKTGSPDNPFKVNRKSDRNGTKNKQLVVDGMGHKNEGIKDLHVTIQKIMQDNQRNSENLENLVRYIEHKQTQNLSESRNRVPRKGESLPYSNMWMRQSKSSTSIQMMPSFKKLKSFLKRKMPNKAKIFPRSASKVSKSKSITNSMRGVSPTAKHKKSLSKFHLPFSERPRLMDKFAKKNSMFVMNMSPPVQNQTSLSDLNVFSTPQIEDQESRNMVSRKKSVNMDPEYLANAFDKKYSSQSLQKLRLSQSDRNLGQVTDFLLTNEGEEDNLMDSDSDDINEVNDVNKVNKDIVEIEPEDLMQHFDKFKKDQASQEAQHWSFSKNEIIKDDKQDEDPSQDLLELKLKENKDLKKKIGEVQDLIQEKDLQMKYDNERISKLEQRVVDLEHKIREFHKNTKETENLNKTHQKKISSIQIENTRLKKENNHLKEMNQLFKDLSLEKRRTDTFQITRKFKPNFKKARRNSPLQSRKNIIFEEVDDGRPSSEMSKINWRDLLSKKIKHINQIRKKRQRLRTYNPNKDRMFLTGEFQQNQMKVNSSSSRTEYNERSIDSFNIYQPKKSVKDSFRQFFVPKKKMSGLGNLSGTGSKKELYGILAQQKGMNQDKRRKKYVSKIRGSEVSTPKILQKVKRSKIKTTKTISSNSKKQSQKRLPRQRIKKKLLIDSNLKKPEASKTESPVNFQTLRENNRRIKLPNYKETPDQSQRPTNPIIEVTTDSQQIKDYLPFKNPASFPSFTQITPKSKQRPTNPNIFESKSKTSHNKSSTRRFINLSLLDEADGFLSNKSFVRNLKSMNSNFEFSPERVEGIHPPAANQNQEQKHIYSNKFRSKKLSAGLKRTSNSVSYTYTDSNSEQISPINFKNSGNKMKTNETTGFGQNSMEEYHFFVKKRPSKPKVIAFELSSPKTFRGDSDVNTVDDIILTGSTSVRQSKNKKWFRGNGKKYF